MCWVCLPTCGMCRPATKRMVPCPHCGAFTLVDVQDTDRPRPVSCTSCGGDITLGTVPQPRFCVRYGRECGNPCGLGNQPFDGTVLPECEYFHAPFACVRVMDAPSEERTSGRSQSREQRLEDAVDAL